ncbi:MAG: DegT/DnrJ/EryC1/StrS family aminotransferase, partial [Chthoniobacterales bacterium]
MTETSAARPAFDGGKPVRETFLPFCTPFIGDEEKAEVIAALESGWLSTGPRVKRFEEEAAAYLGT